MDTAIKTVVFQTVDDLFEHFVIALISIGSNNTTNWKLVKKFQMVRPQIYYSIY